MSTRSLKVAAAQIGAVHLISDRKDTLQRMVNLLKEAAAQNVKLVVYPETTFTTFFPRYLFKTQEELDVWFEHGNDVSKNEKTKPLFDEAKAAGIDICIGFAERTEDGHGFNTCVYYSAKLGKIVHKYRKIHLPGTVEPFPDPEAINQLEKRYFEPGNLGFTAFRVPELLESALKEGTTVDDTTGKGDPVMGMMICNDRRWPESWRCYGLQGVELVMCGYNTTSWAPDLFGFRETMSRQEAIDEAMFQHKLVMEANSYMNSCFSISAARCGMDDGKFGMIGGSAIVAPTGHTLAMAKSTEDELVVAEIDLEDCWQGKKKVRRFPHDCTCVHQNGYACLHIILLFRSSISPTIDGQKPMDS
jgi:predicted amidohydrolase